MTGSKPEKPVSGDVPERDPDDRGTYTVGYGKPPEHGKIKPGEVRNPRGKARGTRSYKSEIREMLAMPVPLNQGGKVRRVTTRMAVLIKLREKALKGDMRAIDRLFDHAAATDEADASGLSTTTLLGEDQLILEHAREREAEVREAERLADIAAAAPKATSTPNEKPILPDAS